MTKTWPSLWHPSHPRWPDQGAQAVTPAGALRWPSLWQSLLPRRTKIRTMAPDTLILLVLATTGALVLWAVPAESCRWCEHCRRAAADKARRQADSDHLARHRWWGDVRGDACDDPKCRWR